MLRLNLNRIDAAIISGGRRWFPTIARLSIGLVYIWFGLLKMFGLSPATPLAQALTHQTLGVEYFGLAFTALAAFELLVGMIVLIPSATRLVIPLLALHMLVVCSPLVLVPSLAWTAPFVPSLEGQYIIKNVLILALAIGMVAYTKPLKKL